MRIIETPNDGPPLEDMWAFVSRDQNGNENVIGGFLPGLGMTALVTGNPKTFEYYKRVALNARSQMPRGQTLHLLRFSNREEIPNWHEQSQ